MWKTKKSSQVASLMENSLNFMCSIGKFFLRIFRLKSLACFTHIGPNTYILLCKYCYITKWFPRHLDLNSSGVIYKTRERTSKAGAATQIFKWMSHFSTTGVIKPTNLLRFFKNKQVNELIRVKIVIILSFRKEKVIFMIFYVKDVNKSVS